MKFDLTKSDDMLEAKNYLAQRILAGSVVEISLVPAKQRTLSQNSALWLMFSKLADELNESGFDMKRTLKQDAEIPWNKDTVHDYLWVPIQKAQLQKESTTDLTTTEIDAVFATLNRHLGDKLGISLSFPNIDTLLQDKR